MDSICAPLLRLRQKLKPVLVVFFCFSSMMLTSCQTVKLSGQAGQTTGSINKAAETDTPVAGNWQVSYSVGGETRSAHMNISQNGATFQGLGIDDSDQQNFVIDAGSLNGKSVSFHKRYHVDENPNLPPIVYTGTFEMAKGADYTGPYMSGTYKRVKNGQTTEGQWDAEIASGGAVASAHTQEAPPPPVNTNHRPHLSGKWDAGYEFEFKTVRSSMYLEQDGTKITGHGMDRSSKEAFTIKGNYKFPDIKMWVKYLPVKASGKNKAKGERSLEFRGKAAVVNESDYQGTRMEGKTNGGGMWMAEQVK